MKLILSIVSPLLVAAIIALFSYNSRITALEAKVPVQDTANKDMQKVILGKLTRLEQKMDNIHLMLIKKD